MFGGGGMSDRTILHCDLNNFFASVECMKNPKLALVPLAVCGSEAERRGIVLAKNEKAKKYGVKTAETIWQAKQKCPNLVTVPPHYEEYLAVSKKVRSIYEEYTELVEPFGIDECWLDVTGSGMLFGSGEKIANELRERIKKELGVTISVGVSFNKVFAKLGSDMKKPNAVTLLLKENFKEKIYNLPAEAMLGVGRQTQKKLNRIGIFTLGELAGESAETLKKLFGKAGTALWQNANGYDMSPVLSRDRLPAAKSFSKSMTCRADLENNIQVGRMLLYLAENVAESLRESGTYAGVVRISVRDSSLVTRERQCALEEPTRLASVLYEAGMDLFASFWQWDKNVRSVGICADGLVGECGVQYSLFSDAEQRERMEKIENQMYLIRRKYGSNAIFRASSMGINEKNHGFGAY